MIRIDHDGDDKEHMTVRAQHTLGAIKSDTATTVHDTQCITSLKLNPNMDWE